MKDQVWSIPSNPEERLNRILKEIQDIYSLGLRSIVADLQALHSSSTTVVTLWDIRTFENIFPRGKLCQYWQIVPMPETDFLCLVPRQTSQPWEHPHSKLSPKKNKPVLLFFPLIIIIFTLSYKKMQFSTVRSHEIMKHCLWAEKPRRHSFIFNWGHW